MSNRKRALLISCSIILLCVSIIAGMTYSLFTESFTVKNHLQAGDLDIKLTRTSLKYGILNDEGYIEDFENDERVELTNTTTNDLSIFGFDSSNIRIVPESYFEADLEIKNNGNVAFTYDVRLVLDGVATDLAKQLKVTTTTYNEDGITIASQSSRMVSDLDDGFYIIGDDGTKDDAEMARTAKTQRFTVRIDFVDDVVYNANHDFQEGETLMDNDLAQTQIAKFDLIVTAVQKSKPAETTTAP